MYDLILIGIRITIASRAKPIIVSLLSSNTAMFSRSLQHEDLRLAFDNSPYLSTYEYENIGFHILRIAYQPEKPCNA